MDVDTMKAQLPSWPHHVQPVIDACQQMQSENGVPLPVYGLAAICAGWKIVAEICGGELAATALLAAMDALREACPERVALAESVHRQRQN